MILELRHDIMGAFGRTYIEERTSLTDAETVTCALNTFRKEKGCVLWIEEVGDASDYGTVTGICVSWETYADYEDKQATVTRYFGAGNVSDTERMEWRKARNYLKKFIETH